MGDNDLHRLGTAIQTYSLGNLMQSSHHHQLVSVQVAQIHMFHGHNVGLLPNHPLTGVFITKQSTQFTSPVSGYKVMADQCTVQRTGCLIQGHLTLKKTRDE